MPDEFFNDGAVPHGGFLATFASAGVLVMESFSPDFPSKVIERPSIIGAAKDWAGVKGQKTATGTVQVPDSTGSLLQLGDYFTADAAHGGGKWVVTHKGQRFNMGDYWKEEISLHLANNG